MDVRGKRVLVVGLARSGFSVALALARRGAVVTVTDLKPPSEFRDLLPPLLKGKIGLELGSQRQETFLHQDVIVISPGVPWDLPQLQTARQQQIPIYPEVEAATWFLEGTLVGITGSNGKTTTTALLGDMLRGSRFPTFVGGNIGNALSTAVDHASPGTMFVTELSSFQLEGIQELHPHVAVMLNLSPNHLDRHPNLEAYAQAKRQIFRNQRGRDFAILNADDPWVATLQAVVSSRPVFFSRQRELANGIFVSGGKIYYRVRHLERVLFETRDVTLRGDFNLEDVLAATAAACVLGADFAAIRKALREFQGVEHRLEFVREVQGVDFYNNSKATSVDATVKSLEAFERGVHLILGGKDKGAPYTPLIPLIKERVRDVLLIGAAAPVIAKQLARSGELVHAGDLATAVREAFIRSRPGDTVLLAPACSSFDQFKDYEQRGRVFKGLVKQLAREVSTGAIARQTLSDAAAQEPPSTPVVVAHPVEPLETEKPSESLPMVVEPPPHHVELSYVYEVETVEMPPVEMEAQISPEEEPAISPRASETEAIADEPLPFETRAGLAAVASPAAKKDPAKGKGRSKAGDHGDAPRSSAEGQARLPGLD
jgi:UDP-N-acetylmuramoylalanine--D-glutamate ligase